MSDLVKQGKDLVAAIEGQNKGIEGRIISLSYSNQELIKKLVAALEKAEKKIVYLDSEIESHYWDSRGR